MIFQEKKNVLGILIDVIDYDSAVQKIIEAANNRDLLTVSALAVHGVMSGFHDPRHCYRLNHLDMLVPDGQPVRWALNLLYNANLSDRVYGPTLMLKVCEEAAKNDLSIFLYGSKIRVLEALQQRLTEKYPALGIAGAHPSKFRQISREEMLKVASQIRKSEASIIFVGLGCPRQEVWVYEYRKLLSIPMIAVGAAFDFHAGFLPQAPKSLQRWGLEWFFRLMQEPQRLWKRYLLLNPEYLALLFLQWTKLLEFDPAKTVKPNDDIRYG
jgi:exopolysaccharide biosynthesis WecB/TagA/CpsF family protein